MSARLVAFLASQNSLAAGGLLLALGYFFWTCNVLAPQLVPGSSNAIVSYASLVNYGIAALLRAVGVTALVRGRTLGGPALIGAWLLVAGFLLWALGAVSGLMPFRLPWWFQHLSPLCIMVGSALFGLGAYATALVHRLAALLVGAGGGLG